MSLKLIEKALKKYLPKDGGALSKAMRYSVFSGGKRVRPMILIESSKTCGAKIPDALPAACAIELVHTYSLIHDDLPAMDNDDFRRGKPTCHKVYGEANAILAGDALLTLAFNIIAANTKPAVGVNIIRELSSAIGVDGMVGGQALDLEFRSAKKSKNTAGKINLLKTAKLFAASAKIGALVAGANLKKVKALERFGLDLGLSFQIIDDYLDGEDNKLKDSAALIEKAKNELTMFGKRGDGLKRMIEKLASRKR